MNTNNIRSIFAKTSKTFLMVCKTFVLGAKYSKFFFWVYLFTRILNGFLPIAFGYYLKIFLDSLTTIDLNNINPHQNAIALIEALPNSLFVGILGFIITYALTQLNDLFSEFAVRRRYLDISRYSELEFMNALSNVDLQMHSDTKFMDNVQIAKEKNTYIVNYYITVFTETISQLISIISIAIILLNYSPITFWVLTIAFIPETVLLILLGKGGFTIYQAGAKNRRAFQKIKDYLFANDYFYERKICNSNDYLINMANEEYQEYYEKESKLSEKRLVIRLTAKIINIGGYVYSFFIALKLFIQGLINIGSITYLIQLAQLYSDRLNWLIVNIADLYKESLTMEAYFSVLDYKQKIVSGDKSIKTDKIRLDFKNVWFKYPNSNDYIFKDFNLSIYPEEKIAIVGENGAGKSTLVLLICRLYEINKGQILINGIDIKDINLEQYYKKIGLLTQYFNKYYFSAKENIAMGDPYKKINKDRVVKSAIFASASSFIEHYKYKYNQLLSKEFPKGIDPSVGQWQKIAIARAMYREPEILIFDEPTSAIDPLAEFEIIENLYKYTKDKTFIIISHRFANVKNANRIIVLDKGQIIEDGTHDALMKLNGKYATAYNVQKDSLTKKRDLAVDNTQSL